MSASRCKVFDDFIELSLHLFYHKTSSKSLVFRSSEGCSKHDVFVGTDDDKSKIRVHPVDDRTSADLWNISFVKRSFVSPNFGSNAYVPAIRTSTFLWLRGLLGFRGFGFDGFLGFLLSNDFLRRFLALSILFDACASGQYQTEHNEND